MCFDAAQKCTSKKEFKLNFPKQHKAAYRNNWLNSCCSHMIILGSSYSRLIYAFEFPDNSVYIGLTYNPKKRFFDHMYDEKSQVFIHYKKTGETPKFIELTTYLDKNIALKKEGEFITHYNLNGWTILNKAKTGGLGRIIKRWTKENCYNLALKYEHRSIFKKENPSAYFAACKNNWLFEISSHMKYLQKPNGYWSYAM